MKELFSVEEIDQGEGGFQPTVLSYCWRRTPMSRDHWRCWLGLLGIDIQGYLETQVWELWS